MLHAQVLRGAGLIKPSRRGGFCPACRLFQTGDAPEEIAAPALIALAFLVVAALAWVMTIMRISSMDDMAMGLGSFDAFVATWAVMMTAMMFSSALPVVFEFAQHAERRRAWQATTAVLGVTYLGIWLAFGVGCYVVYNALGMP
jgi:predicted metal-binding membrane protein